MSSIKNFLELPTDKQIGETQQFFLIRDGFPVNPGHSFIMKGMNVSLRINRLVEKVMLVEHLDISNPPTDEQILFAKQNRPTWIRGGYY